MNDQELGRIMLEALRDSRSPTHMEDLVAVARGNGVDAWPQITRVADELHRRGYVEQFEPSEQAILARISDSGRSALESGGPEIDHRESVGG
ncbi:hypothetical protein [Tautonia plasticadhaerens]|uniref:Uncharacterized protein n=1 Tax=Tautonia plasticadhaerens TaxID=2527974 RepID=A0A518H0Z8_9BACT|nr:hypothetical protein [Tautonia plasticadhaerens]QDV34529.1 hypothetical protein ElP_24190 [Tautonia plasticadhaerens]